MDQAVIRMDDVDVTFGQRYDDETKKIERKKLALRKEKKELEKERGKLENEKRAFLVEKISEDRRMEREKKLFEMKWKILEDELKKLAVFPGITVFSSELALQIRWPKYWSFSFTSVLPMNAVLCCA